MTAAPKYATISQLLDHTSKSLAASNTGIDPFNPAQYSGPAFSLLLGAGFSLTGGLPSTLHFVKALELYRTEHSPETKLPQLSWNQAFERTADSLHEDKRFSHEVTDDYFRLMDSVCVSESARYAFTTSAIKYASSKHIPLSDASISLAAILISSTGGPHLHVGDSSQYEWLSRSFARHIFTTNFDDLIPSTFYLGNKFLDVIDSPSHRPIRLTSDYPTLTYLHGRHIHYDLRTTRSSLIKEVGSADAEPFRVFRDVLHSTGLIVIGYSGAEDYVIETLKDLLRTPGNLPNGLWWNLYSGANSIHPEAKKLIESSDNAHFIVAAQEDDAKYSYFDSYGLLSTLLLELGLSSSAYVQSWKNQALLLNEQLDSFVMQTERTAGQQRESQITLVENEESGVPASLLSEELCYQAASYMNGANYERAIVLYDRAIEAALKADDNFTYYCRALTGKAKISWLRGESDTADELNNTALNKALEVDNLDVLPPIYLNRSLLEVTRHRFDIAYDLVEKAQVLSRERGLDFDIVNSQQTLSWLHILTRRFDEAIELCTDTIETKLSFLVLKNIPYVNRAHAMWLRGDSNALEEYKRCLSRFGSFHREELHDFKLFVDVGLSTHAKVNRLMRQLGLPQLFLGIPAPPKSRFTKKQRKKRGK